jgi:histidinol-phosphate/aromatic aminotransferase/cobyric acid decarboxylase-like protein
MNVLSRQYDVGYGDKPTRLHLNEFREDHHPDVINSINSYIQNQDNNFLSNYYTKHNPDTISKLADYLDVNVENILLTSGSDDALKSIILTSHLLGYDKIIMGRPSYTQFEQFVNLKQLTILSYFTSLLSTPGDVIDMIEYYDEDLVDGCLVYICNPNNPTGLLMSKSHIQQLIKKYPKSLFILDEAYIEISSVHCNLVKITNGQCDELKLKKYLNSLSCKDLMLTYPNIIIVRSMSKVFGLASIRVGYIISNIKNINKIRIGVSPTTFNRLIDVVISAVLDNLEHYVEMVSTALCRKSLFVMKLKEKGWNVHDTSANFYLIYVEDGEKFTSYMLNNGIEIRDRSNLAGLSGYVRITAGNAEDNSKLYSAFKTLEAPKSYPIQHYYTSKKKITILKYLTRETIKILKDNRIVFWAHSGTLLGMIRHQPGGIIPWDDDVDLAYLRKSEDDLDMKKLVKVFNGRGLTLQRNRTDKYWQVGLNCVGEKISDSHVDIFSFSSVRIDDKCLYVADDPRFAHEDPDSPYGHCNMKFTFDELFPLINDFQFYDQTIPIPNKYHEALIKSLGNSFMQVGKIRFKDGIIPFILNDRYPA